MAAVSAAQTTTATLTPPASSHGHVHEQSWGHTEDHAEDRGHDFTMPAHSDYEPRSPTHGQNGTSFSSGAQMATRRMNSAEHHSGDKWDEPADSTLLPAYAPEPQNGGANWRSRSPHKGREDYGQNERAPVNPADDSKWIHRDKLAKIESQELQAAGFYVPRSRAPSKQRRDRSRSAMRRGTDGSDQVQTRSRKNSAAVEHRAVETSVPSWDLRTPEEIAEEEAKTYFTNNGLGGNSRIPVAKTSPAPISLDSLERGSPATGKMSESPEGDYYVTGNSRSRSASASLRGLEPPNGALSSKRSQTDMSPKKPPPSGRKTSNGARNGATQRPKTRSGSSGGTRPPTRSGDPSAPTKQPEGDPPWMINSYKPDPRLPPDQQLLPTVARRLQQERWEKEGTYGDVFDKEFRPLNDKALLKPPSPDRQPADENQQEESPTSEWPLRPEVRSPSIRQGAYSTMPKISDKPPATPIASPRPPQTPQMLQPQKMEPQPPPTTQRVPEEKEDEGKQKGGCACCVIM
ncbi:hypothetical protein ACO1O0_003541 [Amphichorda felina]